MTSSPDSNTALKISSTRILLVGASSFLGSKLYPSLTASGLSVRPTFRHSNLQLDLEKSIPGQLAVALQSHPYSYGIICAAMTDVGQCFANPSISHRINVEAILELLDLFHEFRIKPVFFSSDLVFEGTKDFYCEDDETCPTTLYGSQKNYIEREIQRKFGDYLIFRTSKLMSMDLHPRSILTPIIESLSAGTAINSFIDQFITPVFVEDIARVVTGAIDKELTGLYHLAGKERFSRLELAHAVALFYDFPTSLVMASRLQNILLSERRGSNNTLNSTKIRRDLDFHFTPLAAGLSRCRQI